MYMKVNCKQKTWMNLNFLIGNSYSETLTTICKK